MRLNGRAAYSYLKPLFSDYLLPPQQVSLRMSLGLFPRDIPWNLLASIFKKDYYTTIRLVKS